MLSYIKSDSGVDYIYEDIGFIVDIYAVTPARNWPPLIRPLLLVEFPLPKYQIVSLFCVFIWTRMFSHWYSVLSQDKEAMNGPAWQF